MNRVEYVDSIGRKFQVQLPSHDSEPAHGMVIGPPMLDEVCAGWPEEIHVRLHNELYRRRILTEEDARSRANEIVSALQAALGIDAGRIVREAYRGGSQEDPSNRVHARLAR